MPTRRAMQSLAALMLFLALLAGGAALALLDSGATNDSDIPITGGALTDASAAALEHVGRGSVTETEFGDEEHVYEVEITLDDGTQIDVHLDRNLEVVSTEIAAAGAEDDG